MNLYRVIYIVTIIIFFAKYISVFAQQKYNNDDEVISTSGFRDCTHHWYDIKDEDRIIDPLPDQKRYNEEEIEKIADNVLLFQKSNGGWPKNYDMQAVLTEEQRLKVIKSKDETNTTFDNGATHSHVEYLAKVYTKTRKDKYKKGCLKGIDFILSAQYKNGGWPQYYPLRNDYSKYITFNDGAMIGVMNVLYNILHQKPYYRFIDLSRREKIKKAFEKGVDCILKCQIVENNKPTVWCQQHDEIDFSPRQARSFEPACKCSQESAEIVDFLMKLENPDERVIKSINSAIEWFKESMIYGIRMETIKGPYVQYQYHSTDLDRVVVQDSNAPPIWSRYYELVTNKPIFSNRNNNIVYSLAEVDRERRTGYLWYNYEPQKVIDKYPTWLEKINVSNKKNED